MKTEMYILNRHGKLEQLAKENPLPVGTILGFETQATPWHEAVIISEDFESWGQPCVYLETGHKTHVTRQDVEGLGGWKYSRVISADTVPALVEQAEKNRLQLLVEQAAAEKQADKDKAEYIEKIKKDFSWLKKLDKWKSSSKALAASNIRKEIKRAFPGLDFSVKVHGNCIGVNYTDGPALDKITAIADKYEECSFDGMQDLETLRNDPWTDIYGGARYVMTNRDISDDAMKTACLDMKWDLSELDNYQSLPIIKRRAAELLERV